jgi:hypothetical protein
MNNPPRCSGIPAPPHVADPGEPRNLLAYAIDSLPTRATPAVFLLKGTFGLTRATSA